MSDYTKVCFLEVCLHARNQINHLISSDDILLFWVWIALFFYSRLFSTLIWLAYQTVYKLPWEIYPILINLYWTNLTTTIHNGSLTFFLSSMAISIQKAILIYPVVSEVMAIKELYNINDWHKNMKQTSGRTVLLYIYDEMILRDLVPLAQFQKREKHPRGVLLLVKLQGKSLLLY